MAGIEIQVSVCMGWLSVDCYRYLLTFGFGEGVQKGDSSFRIGLFNGEFDMWIMEFRYCNKMTRFPLGIMLKTSSTYLFQSFIGTGSSGPSAITISSPTISGFPVWPKLYRRGKKLGRKRAKAR